MTDRAEVSTGVGARLTLARWNIESHGIRSPILRYGLSVVSVAIGLGLSLLLQHYEFRDVELPVLTLSVAVATLYAGAGPSVLAILLATACFNYFFAEPIYSFDVSSRDLPYFFVFLAWAAIVASFAAVRRRIEENLRQARDHLQVEVEQRKRREDEIRILNKELVKRATELETSNNELGASGRSPTNKLSIVKQRVRVHGRRLSWLLGWHRSVDRSVLGCVLRALAGVAERRRAGV